MLSAVYGFFFAPATRPLLRCDAEPSSVARMQQVAAAAVEPSAAAESRPLRVDVSSTVTPEATMWCDPSFRLEAAGPACSRVDVGGIESSFMLKDVLTDAEAARMVAMAEKMGIERGGQAMSGTDEAERENGAVSWVLHKELIEQIFSRIAPHLPAHIAVHRPGTAEPENPGGAEKTWVREVAGAPEGIYTLSGLSARSRVYRYSAASDDAFSPHFDETWPGSDLHASAGRGYHEHSAVAEPARTRLLAVNSFRSDTMRQQEELRRSHLMGGGTRGTRMGRGRGHRETGSRTSPSCSTSPMASQVCAGRPVPIPP